MLLLSCVRGVRDELGHFLAAADDITFLVAGVGDDVSAVLTYIEFHSVFFLS